MTIREDFRPLELALRVTIGVWAFVLVGMPVGKAAMFVGEKVGRAWFKFTLDMD